MSLCLDGQADGLIQNMILLQKLFDNFRVMLASFSAILPEHSNFCCLLFQSLEGQKRLWNLLKKVRLLTNFK